ncbi:MAG: hypothetical protein DCC71_00690 [Proteobacteria bacterium]|nr:MAG: hypothetical protein DCC71_00690 [Pseudomonadota bacterium]
MRASLRATMTASLLVVGAASPSHAGPPRYNVGATALSDGDSHQGDNSDPDAVAHASEAFEFGAATYDASADASSGALSAVASRSGELGFTANQRRSVARIEERIHFDAIPAGPVTIRAELSAAPEIAGAGARAWATVRLHSTPTSSCTGTTYVSIDGEEVLAGCNFGDGAGGGFAQITLTPQQLADAGYVVDVDAQVEANVEEVANGIEANASSAGVVSVSVSPDTPHHYTGPNTAFPAPEADAALAGAAAAVALAALRSRRR